MRIGIGCDHKGIEIKEDLKCFLQELGIGCDDFGCFSTDSVDYPDYALKVAKAVSGGNLERGILICFTGIGMSIAANKVCGIRAALCSDPESANLSRAHNNSNVLCLGSRKLSPEDAREIVKAWLDSEFEGGRHERRVNKISQIESCELKNSSQ